jgi:putative two-component system hydrogenase maturation factor HypX/HoxX
VTILEAAEEFDAGAIWASHEFALENDPPAKSSLYRGQVTEAALRGILEAVARIESGEFQSGSWRPEKLTDVSPYLRGCLRPPMRQTDRAIDWMRDKTAVIVRKVRAADSAPGALGTLLGKCCFLYGCMRPPRFPRPGSGPARRRDLHRHNRWRCLDLPSEGQGRGPGGYLPRPGGHRLRALRTNVPDRLLRFQVA